MKQLFLTEKSAKRKVEFTLKLKDRYGKEKKLIGLVDEGITRNEAVAQLVKKYGGICEIKEGNGALKGLRWITRIEFSDGFKIEEWGQYKTEKGELEIGKVKRSLTEKLMGIFFKKFSTTTFWENGDTKRVSKYDNCVLFQEDYGVTSELPSADQIIRSEVRGKMGCSGALKEGEIELVKLAAKIDIERDNYLVDFSTGTVRKEKKEYKKQMYDIEKIIMPKHNAFDGGATKFYNHDLFLVKEKIKQAYEEIKTSYENDIFFEYPATEVSKLEVAPDLFFNKYQNEILKVDEREENVVKGDLPKERDDKNTENENNEKKNKKKKEDEKKEKTEESKNISKSTQIEVKQPTTSEDKIKILSILTKFNEEKTEERKEFLPANIPKINNEETKGTKKDDKNEKKKNEKEKIVKNKEKRESEKKIVERELKKKKEKKIKNNKVKKEKTNKKKQIKKQKPEKANRQKKTKKPKTKVKPEIKTPKTNKKQSKASQSIKKPKIEKIKLPKIKIKIAKVKPPKVKHLNQSMKKGAQIVHQLYLKALREIEKKKRISLLLKKKKKKSK
ncbi:MAG: hypothetical protein QXF70_01615 [Candidatus Bilamarchaeaceae archaeon]